MNPASRLIAIHEEFTRLEHKKQMMVGWKRILGSEESKDEDAYNAMSAALREVGLVQTKLRGLGAPDQLFSFAADQLRHAFSPAHGASSMHQFLPIFQERTVLNSLNWAAWVLAKFDEPDVEPELLAALAQLLSDQEELLREHVLPDYLYDVISDQTTELRAALRMYRIQGIKPLKDAVNESLGAMAMAARHQQETGDRLDPEAQSALKKSVDVLSKAAEVADKGSKVASFGEKIYQLGQAVGPQISQLLISMGAS